MKTKPKDLYGKNGTHEKSCWGVWRIIAKVRGLSSTELLLQKYVGGEQIVKHHISVHIIIPSDFQRKLREIKIIP